MTVETSMNRSIETSLLATKLTAPKPAMSEISRRIVDILLESGFTQSLCVVASAGSGKSTFLRQLKDATDAHGYQCAWLNLDSRDDDAATLIPYLFDAFRRLSDSSKLTALQPVDFDDPSQVRIAFELLERFAAGLNGKSVLFMDDFHYIKNPLILEYFNHLLDASAGHLQMVLGSRVMPDLHIPRRVISGQFATLPDGFLKFSQQEAEQFFANQNTIQLDPDEISALNRSTEGWAAGLQFAAISIKNSPTQKQKLITLPTGSEKSLSDYLATHVFMEQPADMRRFLLKTAPLGRFTAALCKHVSGIEDSTDMLRRLTEANLFLISLDTEGEWFRYHHLFADFLNAQSKRTYPNDQLEIRLLASQWCIDNQLLDEAITHYLEIKHYAEAADLIAKVAIPETRDNGDHGRVLRWIGALPPSFRKHHPQMILAQGLALGFSRGSAEAKQHLDELRAALNDPDCRWSLAPETIQEHLCYAEVIEMLLFAAEEKTDSTIEGAETWLSKWPQASHVNKAIVLNVMTYCHLYNNRFSHALSVATEARHLALQAKSPYVAIWADCLAAMVHTASGDPQTARVFIERARPETLSSLREYTQLPLMVPLLAAQAAYEEGDYKVAFSELSRGAGFATTFGPIEPLLIAYRLQAQMLRHNGDIKGAQLLLEKGQQIGVVNDLPRLSITLLAEQISLHLEAGDLRRAQQICDEWHLLDRSWSRRFGSDNPMQLNNLKRIEIDMGYALGNYAKTIRLCQSFSRALKLTGRPRSLVRVSIMKAVTLNATGKTQQAWREMSDAIRLAKPNKLVSSFAELRYLCLPIVHDIIAHRKTDNGAAMAPIKTPEDWLLAQLQQGSSTKQENDNNQPESTAQLEKLIEALTPRELEMLELVAVGCTNAQIGSHLLVSEPTVKWHLHNAFQKLGVRNRMTALTKARKLGLLSAAE